MATMPFPVSVANDVSLGASGNMGSSFRFYGPRSLYNIRWNGKVSGFLDLIAACAGASWRYNPTERRVELYYLGTWISRIYVFDDVNTVGSTVRSGITTAAGISGDGSGSTGQNGSSGISGDFDSKQTTSSELKISILSDIENSINSTLMPSTGHIPLSRTTDILTTTDRPKVLNHVQQLVNRENESITKQVLLNVNVLSVALTDKDQLGIDWNLVYKSFGNKWDIGLKNTMPDIDQSAISGFVSTLDTANSAWVGSKAMVQALAQQGRASIVRSLPVTTLSLQSAPTQIGRYDSYLASSQISSAAQVGSTTSLIPGAVTSGYDMSLLPFVMKSGEMLLKININMTPRPAFEMQTSGDSKAQFPSYDIQLSDQKVRLRSGETLVLSGFDQTIEDINKVGIGDAGFFGLGGGLTCSTKCEVIVVPITPVVLGRTMEKPDLGSRGPDVSILSYHGNKLISGLLWRSPSSQRQYMKGARKLDKEGHLDIVAIRHPPTVIQAGFVSKSQGAVKGMYSLASASSGQFDGDFLACRKVEEDRYVLVVTLDGVIVPGQDVVISLDEARDRVKKFSARGVLRNARVFVPEGFDFPVKDFDIEGLLAPKHLRHDYRLRQLIFGLSAREWTAVALLGCVVGGSLTAYYLWNAHQEELVRQAALLGGQRRLAELAGKNAQAKQPLDLALLQKPWTLMPDLGDILRAHSKVARVLSLSIQGWLFESSKYDGGVLVATYRRTGSSMAADLTAVSQHLFADRPAFVIDNGNTAALKVDLEVATGSDEPLQSADDALQTLTSHLYRQGAEPELSISQEITPPLPGVEAATEQQVVLPSRKELTLSAQIRFPADLTFQGLPAAGVRITNPETTLKDSQLDWIVTGETYVN